MAERTIEIPTIRLDTIVVTIEGVTPLLTNRFGEKAREKIESKQQKRAKTAREARVPEDEFHDACHIISEGVYGFPAVGIKKALVVSGGRFADEERNWGKWQNKFYWHAHSYRLSDETCDEVVGTALEIALRKSEGIGAGFRGGKDFDFYLWSWLRVATGYLSQNALTKEWRKREFSDEGGEDDEGEYVRPTTFVRPEQEDAVFFKQMIERCEGLPEDERKLARLVFDRASAFEMARELGVTLKDVAIGTTRIIRKLSET